MKHSATLIILALILAVGCTTARQDEIDVYLLPTDPPAPNELEDSIREGIDFLVANQNRDGSWGKCIYKDFNVYAPVPGSFHAFKAGSTGLCLSALIESGDRRPEVVAAIDKCEEWMLTELPKMRRVSVGVVYNIWGHAYGMKALLRLRLRHPKGSERREQIDEAIRGQIDFLRRYESIRGGWGYYAGGFQHPTTDCTSFITATCLISLSEAKHAGFEIPKGLAEAAIAGLYRAQHPDFTYGYTDGWWYAPMARLTRVPGSMARMQSCNSALMMWGDEKITAEVLKQSVNRLTQRNVWLDVGRKTVYPHESYYAVAGYFFYYGHYYASVVIQLLPPDERPPAQDALAGIIVNRQEDDGSWFDYPLYGYHKFYGTGYALMSLVHCRKGAPSPYDPEQQQAGAEFLSTYASAVQER